MNTSLPTAWPQEDVPPNADDIITAEVSRRFPPVLLDDLWAHPHQLSAEGLAERIGALQGQSFQQIRAALQQIVDELEIHRWGFDAGYEAGYAARALADAKTEAKYADLNLRELADLVLERVRALSARLDQSEAGK